MNTDTAPADLELELTGLPDDPTSHRVALRLRLPESDVDLDLLKGRAPVARFAVESLLERQANAANYGATLGEMLLADADLLAAWREARGIAHSRGQRLRLRLCLGSGAEALHTLRWEALRIPGESGFLAQSDDLLFSRYLPSRDRRPVTATPVGQVQALVVVANPSGLGAQLAPVDVEGELRRARAALGDIALRTLAPGERATLNAIDAYLNQGVSLLYLVCHGQMRRGAPYLALENEQGAVAWTAGARLAERLEQMSERPKLVVLAACQSAGTGEVTGNPALAAVGPLLVDAGVPAVVAMQGNVFMQTVERLMPVFFSELRRHGVIDLALATARRRAQEQADWWAPALFMRLRSGRLFVGEETARPEMRPVIPCEEWEPKTVPIPAGKFCMGSDDPDAQPWERPSCIIDLPDYRMGKYPVTNKEYAYFLKARPDVQPPARNWLLRQPPASIKDHPVVNLSWREARAYCDWLNEKLSEKTGRVYRLPTEAEWEKAARGPKNSRFPWGDEWKDGACNVGGSSTTPVTTFEADASSYGCCDMLGNVEEWTHTIWGNQDATSDFPYPYRSDDGREDDEAARTAVIVRRIVRGGSYLSASTEVTNFTRLAAAEGDRLPQRGFRVAMDIAPTRKV
jgi:formylglycine-generating enzyme required for sulfatase activity